VSGGDTAGRRIARARRRRGLSQAVLAGLVGRSESWLSQVERGKRRIDSFAVLSRLAAVLRIGVEEIAEPGDGSPEEGAGVYTGAPQIEQAMMRYQAVSASISGEEPQPPVSIGHLSATARSAYVGYQATRYEATGQILPALIRDAEAASRAAGIADPVVCSVRALVYDVAAAFLNRIGEPVLAWTAADRAMAAAECSGQPLLAAAGAWRLSYVITSRQHPHEALELAMSAAEALERVMWTPSPEQLSVYGALHLAASTAAAAHHDGDPAGEGTRHR
jgi:transcriptional regulator with XRE-family HTH domain